MYWPPESGNMEPSSAKATHAQSEMAPPRIQTRKNKWVLGRGPAMSLAVRKMEEPMMPLTSSSTESSRLRPRTRLGCSLALAFSISISVAGAGFMRSSRGIRNTLRNPPNLSFHSSSHGQFIGGFERRAATTADEGGAVAAGERIGDFGRANRAVEDDG